MHHKVSLKDIAQKVGVSTALVSYVLNNKMENRISKEIAQKIREAAKELNYRTNQIAKSLKTKKTFTIGLIVADISNPFFSNLARIIEDEAEKNNYTVIYGSSDECAQRSEKLINVLLNRQVDGMIIASAENGDAQVRYLQENEIPVVLIDRYFPEIDVSYVAIDNYKASYAAVKHMAENGYERIGMITYNTSLFHLQERKRGYTAALKENNLPVKKSRLKEVSRHNSKAEVEKAIDELLSLAQPIDAVLFASNVLSVYGLKYLNTLRIKVPDDLAVVSFDQSDAADLFYAPLTYVKQPLQEMGQLATSILLENIGKNNKITRVNMEAALVIGKSTFRKVHQPLS